MAKRKRRPNERHGSKLRLAKDYRSDEYVTYIFRAETGILEAWTMKPDLRDGDVRDALRELMRTMKRTHELPALLTENTEEPPPDTSLLEWRILDNLRQIFDENGPLDVEDTIGILTVINNSVGAWNRGMRGQEYLKYIRDFLGGMGVQVQQISEEEAQELFLIEPDDEEDTQELTLPEPDDEDDDSEPPANKKKFLGLF